MTLKRPIPRVVIFRALGEAQIQTIETVINDWLFQFEVIVKEMSTAHSHDGQTPSLVVTLLYEPTPTEALEN